VFAVSRSPRLESIALLTALVLVTGTSMTPPAARAQSTKPTAVVGILAISATTAGTARNFDALRQSLRDGGWVEGDTLRLEVRYSEGRSERFPELAGESVRVGLSHAVGLAPCVEPPATSAPMSLCMIISSPR